MPKARRTPFLLGDHPVEDGNKPRPMEVRRVSLDQLHNDPGNTRKHPEKNLAVIKGSLKEYGQVEPLVVQKGTGKVIGGNGRLEAMRSLGWTECDIVEVDEGHVRAVALSIALNRSAETAEWDPDALARTLQALMDEGFDLAATGFSEEEANSLIEGLGSYGSDDDGEPAEDPGPQIDRAAELQQRWGTATSQLWLVPSKAVRGKEHRILCGDCTKPEDVERLMDGARPNLGLHDPPYGIGILKTGVGDGKKPGNQLVPRNHFADLEGDDRSFDPGHLIDSADVVVLWGANHYASRLPDSAAWIVWDKKDGLPSNDFSDAEVAWVSQGGSIRIIRHQWQGLIRASERGEPRFHPTQKPVEVQAEIIRKFTGNGDLVADWYCGSGTTIVAAEQTGRICNACEIAPKYAAVALERLMGLGLVPYRA